MTRSITMRTMDLQIHQEEKNIMNQRAYSPNTWMTMTRIAVAVVVTGLLLLSSAGAGWAATIWVSLRMDAGVTPPGVNCDVPGYNTIQEAISAASPGDIIKVCPGTYTENVVIGTSDLTVISTDGAPATTVRAAASAIVFFITAPGVTLSGFTIIPDGFADQDLGVVVGIEGNANAKITCNVIIGGRIGISLGCVSFGSTIADNTVSGQTEGGINIDTCEAPPFPGSHDNAIYQNVACSVTSTGSIALGGSSNDNLIHHNVATKISLFGMGNNVHHNTTQVAITDNGINILNKNTINPTVCSCRGSACWIERVR